MTESMPPQDDLCREDWQFIAEAVRQRFDRARPKPGEGKPSKAFLEEERRINTFLMRKAYG
jgi:hypothetical protein